LGCANRFLPSMYELERKADDYREVTKAPAPATTEAAAASDISAPFEFWLNSVRAEAALQQSDAGVYTETPLIAATPQRAETPPPSVTQVEYLTGFELNFSGTLHIEGYFTGKVQSEQGTLVLGEGGEINTDIAVGAALINGTVVGNIKARQRIELGSAARVIGDLHTPALTVMPGAIFEGKCYFREARGNLSANGNGRRRRAVAGQEEGESSGPDYLRARRGKPNGKKTRAARKADWRRS